MKLDRVNLSDPFVMGSFGDGASARSDLPGRAVERAKELTGQTFGRKDIVIIGDTPNDVACGRRLDVKSIAVATGRFDEATLSEAGPDFCLVTYRTPVAFLKRSWSKGSSQNE